MTAPAHSASDAATLRRLLGYARPYLLFVGGASVLSLVFAAGRYARAWLMKPLLDDVLLPAQAHAAGDALAGSFRFVVAVALVIVVVSPLALFGRGWLTQYALGRIAVDVKQAVADKLLHLPLAFHRGARTGDTLSRSLNDAERSQGALRLLLGDLLEAAVMVAIGAGTLLFVSWQLALLTLLAAPPVVAVLLTFAGRVRKSAGRRQAQLGEVTHRLVGILSGIQVIKAFRGEAVEAAAFARETRRLFRREMRVVGNTLASRGLLEMLNNAVGVAILVAGSILVLRGRWGLTTGDVAAFVTVMATTYRPVKTLSRGGSSLMEALASAERFFALLDAPGEAPDPPDAVRIEGVRQGIRFDRVSFSYGREPVLRGVSLEARAGEVVALVGPTGAGKSTLFDLLLRFHAPDEGAITVDGVDVRRIARDSLLDHSAIVTQEPFLFDTTIRENIAYGRPDAGPDAIAAAAKAAHVDEFVDHLPEGFDTEVGEFGLRLSGGQRQRITIARALLKDPSLLLFDEATSALDAKTERSVHDAIEALRGRRTVLVITHRLPTIRRADRIVVLDEGRVAQQGTHEELMRQGGLYRELVALQQARADGEV